jgi:hypothetical protein
MFAVDGKQRLTGVATVRTSALQTKVGLVIASVARQSSWEKGHLCLKASGLPRRCAPDGTTSQLTKAASCQVIGYRNDSGFPACRVSMFCRARLATQYVPILEQAEERLGKEGGESVTKCNRLKLPAADEKNYLTDFATAETLPNQSNVHTKYL